MHSRVWSSATTGIDAVPIEIETDIRSGLPRHRVVGLPYGAVCESLDRIWSALSNSDLPVPRGVITINLAPAELRKDSASLDLPMAIGMLAVSGRDVDAGFLSRSIILGELALDGSIRPVRGVLAAAIEARKRRFNSILVPLPNADEADAVHGISVYAVATLGDALRVVQGRGERWRSGPSRRRGEVNGSGRMEDIADVAGQEHAKRALEIAAAGGHNTLFIGAPGAGKTMLARRLRTLLPPMTFEESVEVSRVYSAKGLLKAGSGLVTERPFRAPHHSISDVGLCGGGGRPVPGEISLAHCGVLFLDELPEFRRSALEVLRQPLEDRVIRIGRARASVELPANFILVASMNPCPCGYLTDPTRECVCGSSSLLRYNGRISGPLLDRIDLHVAVSPVALSDFGVREGPRLERSVEVARRVVKARRRQHTRNASGGTSRGDPLNAQLSGRQIRAVCHLDVKGQSILREASETLGLSGRAIMRTLKIARTIADLSSCDTVGSLHVAEAIQFRSVDRFGLAFHT